MDWKVKVLGEGPAVVRMAALTDTETDAVEMEFPAYVHGVMKTISRSVSIPKDGKSAKFAFDVPEERRAEQSRMEIRYSPSLAMAMVDAIPYLAEYPYGCTEQTLNRFLPTVITRKVLSDMGLDLEAIRKKRSNLNAQEIGEDIERARQWKRNKSNPVFDAEMLEDMVKTGIRDLVGMQLSDGGWGWFSGWNEHSYPHTTALVTRGLILARETGADVPADVMQRGLAWLVAYQEKQIVRIKNYKKKVLPYKQYADNLDALVFSVIAEGGLDADGEMLEYLYRDRNRLSVYGKGLYGTALEKYGEKEKLAMILRNIKQYLVEDDENQTAYLNLGNDSCWWYWYGSEIEAHACYLKLLAASNPEGDIAPRLVKYLLNNRKHSTYWNSTRDTALCIEAFADYIRAAGEDKPDMTVQVLLDGKTEKTVKIDSGNLFTYDNKLLVTGAEVASGSHVVEVTREGSGPVYINGYMSFFTTEDFITKAGLEIKVEREYYRLIPADAEVKARGTRGQALDMKLEKYERKKISSDELLKSGDLVEIELVLESKNDYEYIIFEDMKPAGFEPVDLRSGYTGNEMGAYVEFRDEKVCFFTRRLARGRHSVTYRMRAEVPGRYSALPTKAYAMYAPELKANSDEIKLQVED